LFKYYTAFFDDDTKVILLAIQQFPLALVKMPSADLEWAYCKWLSLSIRGIIN
jgi:hypothetical protein